MKPSRVTTSGSPVSQKSKGVQTVRLFSCFSFPCFSSQTTLAGVRARTPPVPGEPLRTNHRPPLRDTRPRIRSRPRGTAARRKRAATASPRGEPGQDPPPRPKGRGGARPGQAEARWPAESSPVHRGGCARRGDAGELRGRCAMAAPVGSGRSACSPLPRRLPGAKSWRGAGRGRGAASAPLNAAGFYIGPLKPVAPRRLRVAGLVRGVPGARRRGQRPGAPRGVEAFVSCVSSRSPGKNEARPWCTQGGRRS